MLPGLTNLKFKQRILILSKHYTIKQHARDKEGKLINASEVKVPAKILDCMALPGLKSRSQKIFIPQTQKFSW